MSTDESPYEAGRTVSLATLAKQTPTLTSIAAYARLHELEAKDCGYSPGNSVRLIKPMDPDEKAEYRRLMDWWMNLGGEKQEKLIQIVGGISKHIHEVAGRF